MADIFVSWACYTSSSLLLFFFILRSFSSVPYSVGSHSKTWLMHRCAQWYWGIHICRFGTHGALCYLTICHVTLCDGSLCALNLVSEYWLIRKLLLYQSHTICIEDEPEIEFFFSSYIFISNETEPLGMLCVCGMFKAI